jgi:hypothetical protein
MLPEILTAGLLLSAIPASPTGAPLPGQKDVRSNAAEVQVQACKSAQRGVGLDPLLEAHARGWSRLPHAPSRPVAATDKDAEKCRS